MEAKKNDWQLLDFNFHIVELFIRKDHCVKKSVWISEARVVFPNAEKVGWRRGN